MLTIEQFRNAELAKLQTKQNYSDVLQYFTGLIKQLIHRGVLSEYDSEIMAAELCLPISVWRSATPQKQQVSWLDSMCLAFSTSLQLLPSLMV